ncbi:MAG: EAL domain-containing protein [Firmicutes bacterium]|nr:EAL domain-containing protein [Bacillota bacterium]
MGTESISNFNQFIEALATLGHCTDDYLFFGEIKRSTLNFSKEAAVKFGMPSNSFDNASKVCATFTHPEDYPALLKNLTGVQMGYINEFRQDCRWFDCMGNPVWVRIRARVLTGKNGNPDLIVGTVAEMGKRRVADNITGFRDGAALYDELKKDFPQDGFIMRLFIRNMYEQTVKHGDAMVERLQRLVSNAISDSLSSDQVCYYRTRGAFTIFSRHGDEEDAFTLFKNISDLAAKINARMGYTYTFKLRGGVVPYKDYTDDITELIKKCEFSSTFATSLNTKSFYVFDSGDYADYNHSRELLNALQYAVKNDFEGFGLYYQPIFNVKTGKLSGCEALLRYRDDKFGEVQPTEFVPLLEESGLIIPAGRWALVKAIEQCKKWTKLMPDVRVNVNLSYVQLEREEVVKEIMDIIFESGLSTKNLALELTESGSLLKSVITEYVRIFRKAGIKLALDDFGMGYSNLLYLNEMHVDVVKVDRTFVEASGSSEYSYSLIRHIVEMAHSADTKVCVEGIETEEELKSIAALCPDYYQGFYFSRPIPAERFENEYLKGSKN